MLAIIGGTGLTELSGLNLEEERSVKTPYQDEPVNILIGEYAQAPVAFLARHGKGHTIPPHLINYRANIWALKQLDIAGVIAVNAVGSLNASMPAQALVVPHQIIDYTWGRDSTYSELGNVVHIDFTHPYDENLRSALLQAGQNAGLKVHTHAVYGATQGPRLETAAEIIRMERDGCDIVGMTGMPEACLAREIEIPYASLSLVVNMAAGKQEDEITMEEIEAALLNGMRKVTGLISQLLKDQQDALL